MVRGVVARAVRIGFFTDSYKPYVSGVVRSIETLIAELSALGHEAYVFAPGYPRHNRRESNIFRFVSLPSLAHREFRLGIPVSWRLASTAADLRLDLVHVHSPFLMGQLGARLARRLGLPLVFTYHTMYHHYAHYMPVARVFSRGLALRWSRDFCNRCDLVIAPTAGIGGFLASQGVRVPMEVVPTGIYPQRFQEGDPAWLRRTFGLEGRRVLLYAGRLAQEKNIPFLLRTFVQVCAARPDAHLVLAGEGPQDAALRALAAEIGLAGRVTFTGCLHDRELAHCYTGADLFTFPSVTETQGIVLLEAQAAGLPVVALRSFGTSDMVVHGRDGLLCDHSEAEFTRAILSLLDDGGARAAMAAEARAKADGLSAPTMARRLSTLYLRLIAGGRTRAGSG